MEEWAATHVRKCFAGTPGSARRHAKRLLHMAAVLALAALGACASRDAPGFGGRWRPVNRFAEHPGEIPLAPAYTFSPSPVDGTLRTMLERWSRDAKLPMSYEHASDYTLHGPVAGIATTDLAQALEQLDAAYSSQGIAIGVDEGRIVVRSAGSNAPAPFGPARQRRDPPVDKEAVE